MRGLFRCPKTFSNSAGGAYGHTAGNRRTWQTQKAGTGVNKILYRMYLLYFFFSKKHKYLSLFHAEYNFCVSTTIFFCRGFLSRIFQRPCRPVVAASHHQVMPSVGCSTCPSLTSSGSPTEAPPSGVDGCGDVLWWDWYKVGHNFR